METISIYKNGFESDINIIKHGVPQGSVLFFTLMTYIYCINNFLQYITLQMTKLLHIE